MNIVQQIASSVGTATMSVVLTNQIQSHPLAGPAVAAQNDPHLAAQFGPAAITQGLHQAGASFGTTFTVALALIAACFIPAFLLPRKAPHREAATAAAEAALTY